MHLTEASVAHSIASLKYDSRKGEEKVRHESQRETNIRGREQRTLSTYKGYSSFQVCDVIFRNLVLVDVFLLSRRKKHKRGLGLVG